MSVLTKDQLIDIYAERYEVKKNEAKKQIDVAFEFFSGILVDYEAGFKLGNIGTFEVVTVPERAPREYTNMHTGKKGMTEVVPEHTGFKFKPNKGKTGVREALKK